MQPGQQGYGYGGQQQGYPQGYGVPPQAPYASGVSTEGIQSIAMPTMAALGARAATPILFRVMGMAGISLGGPMVYEVIRGLLGFVAIILYFVWFARFYGWVRAARGGTSYSTGLAIGGWFIPFANLVYPFLGLNDAWKRSSNGQGNPLIALWWISYLAATFLAVFSSLVASTHGAIVGHGPSTGTLLNGLGWLNTLSQVAAYGLWALLVKELTAKAR